MTRPVDGKEGGAILPIVAVFSVVMVVAAALVIDVGSLLDEKRQLQNGADAAALGVAQYMATTCPKADCPNGALVAQAQTLADGNARDGTTTIDAVETNATSREVRVRASTRQQDGRTILPYWFAQAFSGQRGRTVHATASATWAGLKRATVLPLTISECDFDTATANGTVFDKPTVVYFHTDKATCAAKTSGADYPGGFGWVVDADAKDCSVTLSAGDRLTGDSGVPGTPGACMLSKLVGEDVLIPVYDGLERVKGKSQYHILGFAEFHLTGYQFPTQKSASAPCTTGTCIGGRFVKFVGIGEYGGPNLGNRVALVS